MIMTRPSALFVFAIIHTLASYGGVCGFLVSKISRSRLQELQSGSDTNADSKRSAELAPMASDAIQKWLFNEPLEQIVPRDSLSSAVQEIQSNGAFWDTNKSLYEKWWLKFEDTVRDEKRPLKDILGKQFVDELLGTVEKADVYDPTTVRAFLQNPAFEYMIGGILYEGIFEFIQRVDIIGNIVNGLPIIGPIRQTIMSEFKKNLDKTLGGQVKTFLSSFNRVAVQRMIDFVLSPSNRISLQKANRNLVQSLLERPVASIVPNKETTNMLRDRFWLALRETPPSEAVSIGEGHDQLYVTHLHFLSLKYLFCSTFSLLTTVRLSHSPLASVDMLYDQVGSRTVTDFADAQKLLDAMPSAKMLIQNNIGRFLDTSDGILLLQQMASR